jgi:broad specificity phosphatase PhoE
LISPLDPKSESLRQVAFCYLRHGETDWNARGVSQGNIDIPLNEVGLAQARAAAAMLLDRGISSIVASTLSRARVTAEVVGQALGLPVALDDGLREVAFGVQEGQPMSEWFAEWVAGRMTPAGAESFDHMRVRAIAALNRALERPAIVLVVAHGALFRGVRAGMRMEPNLRTRNASPIWCTPPASDDASWTLDYTENAPIV